ncbi:MAG TPA: VWA domain-containing protein [Pyrinomonadaceae bacterium]|jgi:VWFA-related protein
MSATVNTQSASPRSRAAAVIFVCLCGLFAGARAQEPPPAAPTPKAQTEDELRINVDLVQADVLVLDREGRFVDNLTRDDFTLGVDGRPQPIAFFERVTAGSLSEEAQLALARGRAGGGAMTGSNRQPLDRGRTVFFFVDDFHLTTTSAAQVRQLLRRFIDADLGQNDQMAIIAASGRVGFLQQMTDERAVLHAAVERVRPGPTVNDYQQPPMTVWQALAVEQNDKGVLGYFVGQLVRDSGLDPDTAIVQVVARAHALLHQSADLTAKTLYALDGALRPVASLPGRKLFFFLSDGFYVDRANTSTFGQLRRVADTAARSGVVIYSLDTRGLSVAGLPDAASGATADPTGQLLSNDLGALRAAQDPLNALARDTGGRAFLNTNVLAAGVAEALRETARYYLLVWQPDEDDARAARVGRLNVTVKGHPEYKVLVRRGYFLQDADTQPRVLTARHRTVADAAAATAPQPSNVTAPELVSAILAPYPGGALPTALSLNYQDTPAFGPVVTASVQVDATGIAFEPAGGEPAAVIEVAGVVFDREGRQVASFRNRLNISAPVGGRPDAWRGVVSQYNVQLAPGLYQVRAATRDVRTGQVGSAMRWIEIPDVAAGQLALASLQLHERAPGRADAASPVHPNIDGRYDAKSALRFRTYIYNAARGGARQQPDVALQVQIFRDDQPVITAPVRFVAAPSTTDLRRLPYEAELALDRLPPGRYQLRVTALDRIAKTSVTRRANFEVR